MLSLVKVNFHLLVWKIEVYSCGYSFVLVRNFPRFYKLFSFLRKCRLSIFPKSCTAGCINGDILFCLLRQSFGWMVWCLPFDKPCIFLQWFIELFASIVWQCEWKLTHWRAERIRNSHWRWVLWRVWILYSYRRTWKGAFIQIFHQVSCYIFCY